MSRRFVYYGAGRSADELLLDLYPAVSGYSLRKLRALQQHCITVRRGSDNAELDIGFSGLSIDTSQLLNFVGSSDGFVARIFNQGVGGAQYDAVQTTLSFQPKIVDGGVVKITNGLPSIQFSGSQFLELDNLASDNSETQLTGKTSFIVAKIDDASVDGVAFGFGNDFENTTFQNYSRTNNVARIAFRSNNPQTTLFASGVNVTTNQHLITARVFIDGNDNLSFYYNGNFINQFNQNLGEFILNKGAIGCMVRQNLTFFWNGSIQEIIFFDDDVLSNIPDINTNIIDYYDIN